MNTDPQTNEVHISYEAAALVCHFLDDLSTRMTRAGCNDFEWPGFMTKADVETVWSLVRDWGDETVEDEPPSMTFDWLVVGAIGEHIDDRMAQANERTSGEDT